jgi:hypothetical protein
VATQRQREAALEKVKEFEARRTPGVFTAFSRSEVAAGLKRRVERPEAIDQQSTQLCGPAAFMHCLASDQPSKYVGFVSDLYETGSAYVHEAFEYWSGITIRAGSHLLGYRPPARDINPADWIALASLRDSENWIYDYRTVEDSVRRGGTWGSELAKWLRRFGGYDRIVNETNDFFNKGEDHLHRACALFTEKFRVFMLVDADCLHASENSRWSWRPNHWVVLKSPVRILRDTVQLDVYSWGSRLPIVQNPTVRKADFLEHYYGFVAAKY